MKGYQQDYESMRKRCVLYAIIASLITILLFVGVMSAVFIYIYEINPLIESDDDSAEESMPGNFMYSVDKNDTIDGDTYSITLNRSSNDAMFITYMEQAAETDPVFAFSAQYYPGLGYAITAIDGLKENSADQLFWAFMKRDELGDECLLPIGVSSYAPEEGDHMVMMYTTYDIFNTVSNCNTTQIEPHS